MGTAGGTILHSLWAHARDRPGAAAIVDDEGSLAFADLAASVAIGARRLAESGVCPGDRVLVDAPSSAAFAIAYFAVHAARGVVVPVDPTATRETIAGLVSDTDAVAHLTDDARRVDARTRHVGLSSLRTRASGDIGHAPPGEPVPSDPADILLTTGTTGRPQGVVLTHGNIVAAAASISAFMQQTSSDVEVVTVPFSHSFGLGRLRCAAFTGNTLVPAAAGLRAPARLIDLVARHRATGLAIAPAGMALLRQYCPSGSPELRDNLAYVELASAAIARDLQTWICEVLPRTRVIHTYGLTEASRSAWVELSSDLAARGSIGTPSAGVEIELRDEHGSTPAIGADGEIWIRGAHVTQEYWRNPERTAAALRDGWLRTSDIAIRDEAGALCLRGRSSDLINVGGLKVAPAEIEAHLREHTSIADAACVGVSDPQGIAGERVKAFVVSKAAAAVGMADVVTFLRRRGVESWKIPVAIEQIDALPRTSSGKLLRRHLKDGGV